MAHEKTGAIRDGVTPEPAPAPATEKQADAADRYDRDLTKRAADAAAERLRRDDRPGG